MKSVLLLNLFELFHKLLHLHELKRSNLQKEKVRIQIEGNVKLQKGKLNTQQIKFDTQQIKFDNLKRVKLIIKKAFLSHPFLKFSYPYTYTPELSSAFRKELIKDFTSHL